MQRFKVVHVFSVVHLSAFSQYLEMSRADCLFSTFWEITLFFFLFFFFSLLTPHLISLSAIPPPVSPLLAKLNLLSLYLDRGTIFFFHLSEIFSQTKTTSFDNMVVFLSV